MCRTVLIAILFGIPLSTFSAETKGVFALYPALMDTLMMAEYRSADTLCDYIEREHPGHPAAIYARACVIYAQITDFEDTTGQSRFFQLCDSCIDECSRLKDASEVRNAELSFLRGSALSAKALILNRAGNKLSALRLLMSARGEFQEAIEADSTFYDAYLGRGAYRYGAATNASLLSWLPFVPSAESGWKDMWLAVDRSRFSKYYALSALVWFVIDKRDFTLADSICEAGLKRFPGCRSFLWPRLSIRMRQQQWSGAAETAHELLSQYLALPINNGYDVTGLHATLMTCADSLGNPVDAVEFARRGLAVQRTPYAAERRKEKLNLLRERIEQAEATHRGH